MSRRFGFADSKGFSLVELMIVVMMMGIVTMAIYSLYENTQRTATTQDQTVEIQQNLRVAVDQIARDIRMAGFMIPTASTPIATANQNSITFNIASASGRAARINQSFTVPDPGTLANVPFTVAAGGQASLFANDDYVRIIRPPNQGDLFPGRSLRVTSSNPAGPTVTITGFTAADAVVQIRPGDIIALITNGSPNPNTITYSRSTADLNRVAANTQVLASGLRSSADANLDGLQFRYILDDGTEQTTVPTATLDSIKAVRVTLTGEVNTQQGLKTRSLTSIVALRNR
jgi:prepilin-type N-terminal cleavage/methylation domain-containing protein